MSAIILKTGTTKKPKKKAIKQAAEIKKVDETNKSQEPLAVDASKVIMLKPLMSAAFVGLVPRDYTSLIVKYDRDVVISCAMPEASHDVLIHHERIRYGNNYDYYDDDQYGKMHTIKHVSPPLLFRLTYVDIPKHISPYHHPQVRVHIYDAERKDKILAVPFMVPNVGYNGEVCYGNTGRPKDLKQVVSLFWATPFNHLNVDSKAASNVQHFKEYKTLVLPKQRFIDITTDVCGTRFWSTTTQKADGILITDQAELLQQIPREYWLRNVDDRPLIIMLAYNQGDHWLFRNTKIQFTLPLEQVKTVHSNAKNVISLKKKYDAASPILNLEKKGGDKVRKVQAQKTVKKTATKTTKAAKKPIKKIAKKATKKTVKATKKPAKKKPAKTTGVAKKRS